MRPNGAIITTEFLLSLAIQRQQTQLFGFILMTEGWLNEHKRLYYLPLLSCENEIVDGVDYDERHMHGHFQVWIDRGLKYTTTFVPSQRIFSGSSLEWIELPSIRF